MMTQAWDNARTSAAKHWMYLAVRQGRGAISLQLEYLLFGTSSKWLRGDEKQNNNLQSIPFNSELLCNAMCKNLSDTRKIPLDRQPTTLAVLLSFSIKRTLTCRPAPRLPPAAPAAAPCERPSRRTATPHSRCQPETRSRRLPPRNSGGSPATGSGAAKCGQEIKCIYRLQIIINVISTLRSLDKMCVINQKCPKHFINFNA